MKIKIININFNFLIALVAISNTLTPAAADHMASKPTSLSILQQEPRGLARGNVRKFNNVGVVTVHMMPETIIDIKNPFYDLRGLMIAQYVFTPVDSQQNLLTAVQEDFSALARTISDKELLERFGSAQYGRDPKKWVLMYQGKPFTEYTREEVMADNGQKMQELYSNGPLVAVYND